MSMTKDDRLQIRVGPAEKRLLERAAAATHVSVSAFVVQSAAARAATVVADRPLIELGSEAAAAFTPHPHEAHQEDRQEGASDGAEVVHGPLEAIGTPVGLRGSDIRQQGVACGDSQPPGGPGTSSQHPDLPYGRGSSDQAGQHRRR